MTIQLSPKKGVAKKIATNASKAETARTAGGGSEKATKGNEDE